MNLLDLYYQIKPIIPRRLQLAIRRQLVLRKLPHVGHIWPIDPAAGQKPDNWPGWPDNKQFALACLCIGSTKVKASLTEPTETTEKKSFWLPLIPPVSGPSGGRQ